MAVKLFSLSHTEHLQQWLNRTCSGVLSQMIFRECSVDCTLSVDTIDRVKQKIWAKCQHKFAQIDYPELDLYRQTYAPA